MGTKTKKEKPPESIALDLWDADERFKFFGAMASLNIHHVRIEYSGSGDNGAINEILAYAGENGDDAQVNVEIPADIREKLDYFACAYLDHLGYDWVNNEGGHGTLTLYPKDSKAELVHESNIHTVETNEHELEL